MEVTSLSCGCSPTDPGRCGAPCYKCAGAKKIWRTWPFPHAYVKCYACKGTRVNSRYDHRTR